MKPTFVDILRDALRFWERSRILYNLVLATIVVFWFAIAQLYGPDDYVWNMYVFTLIFLAIVANVLYCAAYVVDLPAQCTPYHETWRRWRWMLWFAGTLFAALMATLWFYAVLVDVPPEF